MTRYRVAVFVVGVGVALLCGMPWRGAPVPAPTDKEADAPPPAPSSSTSRTGGTSRRDLVRMGTLFTLVVDAEPAAATPALDAAAERLRALEDAVSSWRPGSDVSRLNARAGHGPVEIGADALALLVRSKALHDATDGSFDVTIGPVWDLWPFRDPRGPLPTPSQLQEALGRVGAGRLTVDEDAGTAALAAGMRVNLGALGKGYAAQAVMKVFEARGIRRAAISAGGDLFVRGRKTDGPWVVGVEHPRWKGRVIERFVAEDLAVATSGDSERRVIRDGRSYGHILDPRTGRPAEGALAVTVVTGDPVAADAYATAVFVMGPAAGMGWVERQAGVEALIVDARGVVSRSSGWRARVGRSPAPAPAAPSQARVRDVPPHRADSRTTPATEAPDRARPRPRGASPLVGPAAWAVDRTEVANHQYRRFLDASSEDPHRFCHPDEPAGKDHTPRYWRDDWQPPYARSRTSRRTRVQLTRERTNALAPFSWDTFRDPRRPVVGVDWWDAYAYARWAGGRLPSKRRWQGAAAGRQGRLWPWGDDWDRARANVGGERSGERDGHIYAAPVDSFRGGASRWGALNLAGNVAEWTEEGWVAGGSSKSNASGVTTTAGRFREPGYRAFDIGFRCASAGPP